ncbi:MAG: hypothetical protein Q8L88_00945 [Bacteroidota bacterium]|nr:hypothetical protein [Bacteroidota bacterium]
MKTNTERRNFFKKAGLSAISAGVMSMLPFKLFAQSHSHDESKNHQSKVNITINPMAVKREKRK